MHKEAVDFVNFVKKILKYYFVNKNILDVGSGDITPFSLKNGTKQIKDLFY